MFFAHEDDVFRKRLGCKNFKFTTYNLILNRGGEQDLGCKNDKFTASTVFVRSGYISLSGHDGATFWYAGQWGYDSTSRATTVRYDNANISSSYYFNFNSINTYSSGGPNDRWYAFPLRCLSTVLDI